MNKNTRNYSPFMKKLYRISKERLEAYLNTLGEANDLIKELRPKNDKGKVDWETLDKAWVNIINVWNSMYGFKNYEDKEAGGEYIQDLWINFSDLDEDKFFEIEFPNGIDTEDHQTDSTK